MAAQPGDVKHGLVIGKFYPPHAGHELLVRTAAALCARVTVVVMASKVESLALEQRVTWLREIHAHDRNVTVTGIVDDEPIDYNDDAVWRAHVALMLRAAREVTHTPIDCAFTSEAYGAELARRLGARHVAVDPARELVPISASALRADPSAGWEYLAPCVRQDLARRVVLVGAESTGKTTLALRLAERLRQRSAALSGTQCVLEYGREHTLYKLALARGRAQLLGQPEVGMDQLQWTSGEFVTIAQEQSRREAAAARSGSSVLLCDTDAFATGIWHRRYCGNDAVAVDALAPAPSRRLYLLTHDADIPFTQDGIRDGEAIRSQMTQAFAARLATAGYHWEWLRGDSLETRCEKALQVIDDWLTLGLQLTQPLAADG